MLLVKITRHTSNRICIKRLIMRVLLSYPSSVGIFDLAQDKEKKYHIIFEDDSIGSFSSVQDAVDALVENKMEVILYETKERVDTSTLGIPSDYTQWDSNY